MKRKVGRPRKQKHDSKRLKNDASSTSNGETNCINPEPEYKFLKSALSSSKLMILRRIANHSYLALEPPEFLINPGDKSNEKSNQEIIYELFRMGGKLHLLDRVLQKLISTGHKVGPSTTIANSVQSSDHEYAAVFLIDSYIFTIYNGFGCH